jgi:hypothetical protein
MLVKANGTRTGFRVASGRGVYWPAIFLAAETHGPILREMCHRRGSLGLRRKGLATYPLGGRVSDRPLRINYRSKSIDGPWVSRSSFLLLHRHLILLTPVRDPQLLHTGIKCAGLQIQSSCGAVGAFNPPGGAFKSFQYMFALCFG